MNHRKKQTPMGGAKTPLRHGTKPHYSVCNDRDASKERERANTLIECDIFNNSSQQVT